MNPATIRFAVLAGLSVLLFSAGWTVEGWRKDAEIADLKTAQQAAVARVAQQAVVRIAAANKRADELQTRLAAEETARATLAQEKDLAIRRLTVGRRCLDRAAVRVLNQPAGLNAAALPEATGEPDRTDAPFATDTDVGLWIGQCQRSYDTCRGRLQAIGDFYEGLPSE